MNLNISKILKFIKINFRLKKIKKTRLVLKEEMKLEKFNKPKTLIKVLTLRQKLMKLKDKID